MQGNAVEKTCPAFCPMLRVQNDVVVEAAAVVAAADDDEQIVTAPLRRLSSRRLTAGDFSLRI